MAAFFKRNGSAKVARQGGTACDCKCGGQVHWNRKIFQGNVVAAKEKECHDEVCQQENIPGLQSEANCNYAADMTELTGGTVCSCECGGKPAWRNKKFYGNVVDEKEKECKEKVCPRVSSVPGLRFDAHCMYHEDTFAQRSGIGHKWMPTATIMAIAFLMQQY